MFLFLKFRFLSFVLSFSFSQLGNVKADKANISTHLEIVHEAIHLAGLEDGEHGLAHIESVSPVVVLHRTVVFLHAQDPLAQNLQWKRRRCAVSRFCPSNSSSGEESDARFLQIFRGDRLRNESQRKGNSSKNWVKERKKRRARSFVRDPFLPPQERESPIWDKDLSWHSQRVIL